MSRAKRISVCLLIVIMIVAGRAWYVQDRQNSIMAGYTAGKYAGKIIGQCESTKLFVNAIDSYNTKAEQQGEPQIIVSTPTKKLNDGCRTLLPKGDKEELLKRKTLAEMMLPRF